MPTCDTSAGVVAPCPAAKGRRGGAAFKRVRDSAQAADRRPAGGKQAVGCARENAQGVIWWEGFYTLQARGSLSATT
jgi:hypothetical protein